MRDQIELNKRFKSSLAALSRSLKAEYGTMAAALQAKPFVSASKQCRVQQRKAVTVCVQQRDVQPVTSLKLLATGLAAAAFLHGAPAEAGVILTQPETKKVFFDDGSAPAKKSDAPKAAKPAKAPSASFQSGAPDFKAFALPASLAAIAGGAFVLSKVDPGFVEMMEEAGAKDSRAFAGYETSLKDTPFFGGNGAIASSNKFGTKKAGTTKKGTTSSKTTKGTTSTKGSSKGGSILGSVFGSRD